MSQQVSSFDHSNPKFFARYKKSGIPRNFWEAGFKDYTLDSKITTLIQNYIRKFDEMQSKNIGMTLVGSSGTGKSMLAAIIAKYVSAYYAKNVRWVQLDDLIYHLNKSWVDGDELNRLLTLIQLPTLLVLDDVPRTANQSKDVSKILHTILRYRVEAGKPLICTTTLTEPKFAAVVGVDVVKELFELAPKIEISSKDNFRDSIHLNKLSELRKLLSQ